MQKSKNINIIILAIICIYSLFSQFYLLKLGNYYTYIINPLFFAILAIITGLLIGTSYKSGEFKKTINIYENYSIQFKIYVNFNKNGLFDFSI